MDPAYPLTSALSELFELDFRWVLAVCLFITLFVSKHYRQKARKARQRDQEILRSDENLSLILARLFVALPMFGAVLAYIVSPSWMAWAHVDVPVWVHSVGTVMVILAVPFGYWVLSSLGDNISETVMTRPGQELVTHGPYRWIRHPLYTNGLLLFVGAGLGAENWFISLFAVLTWAGIYLMVIPREEEELLKRFGADYQDYIEQTGALLPPLRSSEPEAA